MNTMTSRIEKFINEHKLDSDLKEEIEKLVKRCIGDLYEHVKDVPVQVPVKEKSEKLDDPTIAQERDDLRNCKKEVLNTFCKENGLRVGGTKKEVIDRVWRHIQDESTDEDISPRSEKKKKEKKVVEKHTCSGCTSKGTPCKLDAEDEMICGKFYCWRHAKEAIQERKKSTSSKESSDDEDDE